MVGAMQTLTPEEFTRSVAGSYESIRNTLVHVLSAEYSPVHGQGSDLLVVPLAFQGDRSQFYNSPPSRAVAVHDWLWRPHGVASA